MITKASPAKVNLYLRVLRKREGRLSRHPLPDAEDQSLRRDDLFADGLAALSSAVPDSSLPEDEGNIVYRAAAAFFSRIGDPAGNRNHHPETDPHRRRAGRRQFQRRHDPDDPE